MDRVNEKKSNSASLLKKLPALSMHLSEKQKVVMKDRPREFSESRTPYKSFTNKLVSSAIAKAVSEGLNQDRWEQFTEDQAGSSLPLQKPLKKVIARSGYSSGSDQTALEQGKIKVNGKVIMNPQFLVTPRDEIVAGDQRLLIGHPRLWRFFKGYDNLGKVVRNLDERKHFDRIHIPGLPTFCHEASRELGNGVSGLILFTNDDHLSTYLRKSADIERDWEVSVNGVFHQELLRKLSTRFVFDGVTYTNMEWAIKSVRSVSGVGHGLSPNKIIETTLQIRTWGEGPNLKRLLGVLMKGISSKVNDKLTRIKIGPYDLSKMVENRAIECYIDDGLFQFTDPTWQPWIKYHAPLLIDKTFSRVQRYVNHKRSGPKGVDAFEDELEHYRSEKLDNVRKQRKRSHTTAPISPDKAIEVVDNEMFRTRRRQKVVGTMPKTAVRSISSILADIKPTDIVTGIA